MQPAEYSPLIDTQATHAPDGYRPGVIALVPDRWTDIVMPRHQVISRLAKHFPVVWIEPAHSWRAYLRPRSPLFFAADSVTSPTRGLKVFSPGWSSPLVYRPRSLGEYFLRRRLSLARRLLLQRGVSRVILYVWRDEFANALDEVSYDVCCYHVDDEYSFSEEEVPNSPREESILRRADQVIVHSTALLRKKGGINPYTALVPNGVDFQSFAKARGEPADMTMIPHPRIGYAGVIKKQLDLALLVRLAVARPGYSFVLVGPQLNVTGKEEQIAGLRQLPNVYFLGAKSVGDLPAYVQHFDVCLLCYEVTSYTNYIYPLKLNEYLAAGKPTIASPIESVRGVDVVQIANTDDEWLIALDAGICEEAHSHAAVVRRQDFARKYDWDELVKKIARLFHEALARKAAAQ